MVSTQNWDGVPWAVGGGAEHSTNLARVIAYVAFAGQEGIIGPRDLEVRELDVPGTQVRVFPGACCILNKAAGIKYEAYAARLPVEDRIDVAATDGSGPRSDLIVARVENSAIGSEPWDAPADLLSGPYVFTRVLSDVPNTTRTVKELGLGYSALALARIDIPASTGTIEQNMITDLRQMSEARSDSDMEIISPTVEDNLASAAYQNWPSEAAVVADIPEWATHAAVQVILGGIQFGAAGTDGGAAWGTAGDLRIQLGAGSDVVYSQATAYNVSVDQGVDRTTLMAGDGLMAIPAVLRGRQATFRVEGRRNLGNTGLRSNAGSSVSFQAEWKQRKETNL